MTVRGAAALLALLGAGACASTQPVDARADAGERLYRMRCGGCHRLRDPKEHTAHGWAIAVARYGPRAHLSQGQQDVVLEYLQANAKDAPPPEEEP